MTVMLRLSECQAKCTSANAEREQLRRIYSAKLHIILYIKERFVQKVKIMTQFVKAKC